MWASKSSRGTETGSTTTQCEQKFLLLSLSLSQYMRAERYNFTRDTVPKKGLFSSSFARCRGAAAELLLQ